MLVLVLTLKWPLLMILMMLMCSSSEGSAARAKRFLIFPRQAPTRHQFIAGIGIPADLDYEALTVGYVLKAQFYLPYAAAVYRQNPFWPEYNTTHNESARIERGTPLRWHLYEYIESRLNDYGYNGPECVLQAICEANNVVPFALHSNVFTELLHIFLTPSTSSDEELLHVRNYHEAERIGRHGDDSSACNIYHCNWSLLDWITQVHSVK